MLASPGHSPRHVLSRASPSPSVRTVDTDIGYGDRSLAVASTSGKYAARPPLPKKRKTGLIAIDEDTYVAAVEKIIERDFFPDIPKLQNRLEWLEAVRTGDPAVIRDAQINIIRRRRQQSDREKGAGDGLTARLASEFSTPASIASPSMSAIIRSPSPAPSQAHAEDGPQPLVPATGGTSAIDTSVSLDKFLSRYTSEDNASFSTVLERANKQKREKYRFLVEKEDGAVPMIEEGRSTDGFGTSGQPVATLETWPYQAKNLLMYSSADRDDAPPTQRENEEKVEGQPKEIMKTNTRFHGKMFDSKVREEDTVAILYTPVPGSTPAAWPFAERDAARARKRYDLEDLRKSPQVVVEDDVGALKIASAKGVSGYSFVATPSLTPGVEESPFMTWGEIEGTPLRLETEDTPVGIGGSGDGPQFKIPAPPSRDARAHRLSRDAARNLREKSRLQQGHLTPSPARGSASPGMKSFSAAAQKFVSKAMSKTFSTVDARLRASYRASPSPAGTPRMARHGVSRSREGSVASRENSLALRSPSISRDAATPSHSPPPSSVPV